MARERIEMATRMMTAFAERTGLTSERPAARYLWTDAFAVCNLLGLTRATGEGRFTELALRLVDAVHHALGRHRDDDARTGWLSGLGDEAGEAHPTRGGLRIGKPLPERGAAEAFDEELEWERDGQYFHYLTRWMHALDQVARATGQRLFNAWAAELAETAVERFARPTPGGRRRLVWKMSIDLARPLVASTGQHDPLDGFITCVELQATAAKLGAGGPDLGKAREELGRMLDPGGWATADPLGLGGLLADACRVQQLALPDDDLLVSLLESALVGLTHYARGSELGRPAASRLAFRELGLAIGLAGLGHLGPSPRTRHLLDALRAHAPLRETIESFWLDEAHRQTDSYLGHRDINDVMLATALVPEGFLVL